MRRLCCALFLVAAVGCRHGDDLKISDAYLYAPLPGQTTAVGYFTVENDGVRPVRLERASSTSASSIEIHTHVHNGDRVYMRRLDGVDIAAGDRVAFAPGGNHLMVFNYAAPGEAEVAIRLEFAEHAPMIVGFAVRARTGDPP